MFEEEKRPGLGRLIIICAITPAVIIIWAGCKKRAAEPTPTKRSSGEPVKTDTEPATPAKATLNEIIEAARTWRPAYTNWYGKPAPDFTLADLAGKEHKLSDYNGKNVLLVFWATWCPPCRMEIPGLIELRNAIGQDKLAMLAISNENPDKVREFVAQEKINYTVLSDPGALPGPYNTINSIPSSFFINPEGKIKLATSGLISFAEIKGILDAP